MSSNKKTLIDGDFQVGSAHFKVDTENNYVGFNNATPQNKIDVQIGTRTGTHSTGKPLYVTGVTSTSGAEFVSDDGTAGIGIGSSNIFATETNQNITIAPDGTGAVGIKTVTPNPSGETFDLWVQGDTKITGNVTVNEIYGDGSGLFNVAGTQWVSSSEDIYFLNNTGSGEGKVGIGKTVPEYKLDILDSNKPTIRVKSTSTGDGDALLILDSSATGESDIDFNHDGVLNWRIRTGDAAPSGLSFQINNANDSDVLTIQQNGNVGIGTNSPNVPLEVNKSAGGEMLRLATSTGTIYAGVDANPPWFGTSSDDHLRLVTNGTEKVRIESGGNIGIGTTSPDARLHVEEPSAISATTRLFHTENAFTGGSVGHFEIVEKKTGAGTGWSDFTLRLQRRVDVTEQGYIEFNPTGSTGDYGIAFGTGATETMRIDALNGNVGIGTTDPKTRLHVNHDLHLEASSEAWNTTVGKGLYLRYSLTGGQDTAYIQSIDRSNTSLSYPMIFQASSYQFSVGDVGIGKTPSEKLHVHENLSTSGHQIMARIGGDTSSYNTLVFGSKEGRPHIGGHRGDFGAWADLSFQNDLMILQQSTDRVGIGVSDPDSKLEVRGNIHASFSDTNHGMFIDAAGTIRRDYGGNGVGLHFTANQIFPTNYLGSYSAGGIDLGTSTYRWNNVYTEALNASGNVTTGPILYVGTNTNNETAKTIYFGGTYGDNAYDHCVIERRIWQTGTEKQELLLFSGNDGESTAGPDRIRLKGGQILFDTLNNSTDRTTENTKMTVKSDGVVINSGTLRKPGNPGCRVTMTGSQFTLGSGSVFPIVYNSEYHDTGNDYNTSTGKFTCPVAGKYLCIHMMTTRSSRTRVAISEVKLYHNTTETARQFQDITQDSACATNVINCAAGDTLYAGIYNADATNEFNGGTEYGSQFIVEFLG